jgi:hypothetical protein
MSAGGHATDIAFGSALASVDSPFLYRGAIIHCVAVLHVHPAPCWSAVIHLRSTPRLARAQQQRAS